MKSTTESESKKASETVRQLFRTFADSVAEILDDAEVRAKAKALAESVVDAAAKVGQSKVKSEEMRAKYREVGKAAVTLGNSLDKHFTNNGDTGS